MTGKSDFVFSIFFFLLLFFYNRFMTIIRILDKEVKELELGKKMT